MVSIQKSLVLVAVCCSALLASTGTVLGRVVAKSHHQQRQMGCIGSVAMCVMPLMFLDSDSLRQQIQNEGLTGLCQTLVPVKYCINAARTECQDDELPPEFTKAINLLSETVDFFCIAELDSITADMDCMTGNQLEQAVQQNCDSVEPSGEICRLSEDIECGIAQYEEICNNKRLANKFRTFAAKLEKESECSDRKVRSMTWRQLFKQLRR